MCSARFQGCQGTSSARTAYAGPALEDRARELMAVEEPANGGEAQDTKAFLMDLLKDRGQR